MRKSLPVILIILFVAPILASCAPYWYGYGPYGYGGYYDPGYYGPGYYGYGGYYGPYYAYPGYRGYYGPYHGIQGVLRSIPWNPRIRGYRGYR